MEGENRGLALGERGAVILVVARLVEELLDFPQHLHQLRRDDLDSDEPHIRRNADTVR